MDKYIFDDNNGLGYELQREYYIPCLTLPPEQESTIGVWGQRHKRLLKDNHRVRYMNLLTSGKLNIYFADMNEQAEELFSRLVKQMAEKQGVTEKMKANEMMKWVGMMNNIRACAEEVVRNDLIYA